MILTKTNPVVATIKKVMPAVLSVVISKSLKEIEKELPPEFFQMFPFGEAPKLNIPDDKIDAHGMVQIGGGSGFFVDPSGVILTNKHVVSEANAEYTVVDAENKKYDAEILARDPINDIAILRIAGSHKPFPALRLSNSSRVDLGESVIAIGNALGLFRNTVSTGIVSGLSRSIMAQADPKSAPQEMRGLIQTDAAINPGNSGGPLVRFDGEVIGINAAIVFGAQNIGFALPVNSAKRDLEDIKKYGRIKRPLLGLRYITIDDTLQEKLDLPVSYGAIVANGGPDNPAVVANSPAHKAGLRVKDIILECDGEKITKEYTIQDVLQVKSANDVLKLRVLRGGKEKSVNVTLVERK
ncbi:MAG: trypsin-like peptidase domain-containing protein [Candidatus Liptonbacteria bacterium]|nr:trypsin-like peptidase domain-containing protein [Candidatus Liptonbacteria bacterium]